MTTIEEVQSDDQIAEIARLAREIWHKHYVPLIGRDQVVYMLEKFQSEEAIAEQQAKGYEYYIVRHNEQPAGYLAIVPATNKGTLQLSKIYVRKPLRGHGLGKKLLKFAENLSRKRGLNKIWLTVNKQNPSIEWYQRMGFTNVDATVQDIGDGFVMDDFILEKTIEATPAETAD